MAINKNGKKGNGIRVPIYSLTLLTMTQLTARLVSWIFFSSIRLFEGKCHRILLSCPSSLPLEAVPSHVRPHRGRHSPPLLWCMASKMLIAGDYFYVSIYYIYIYLKKLILEGFMLRAKLRGKHRLHTDTLSLQRHSRPHYQQVPAGPRGTLVSAEPMWTHHHDPECVAWHPLRSTHTHTLMHMCMHF